MSKYNTIFVRRGKSKKFPFGKKFGKADLPICKALLLLFDTLLEYDALILAVLKRRDVCVEKVRFYKDRNGRAFQKAQKAAVECDELTARAKSLRESKLALWGDLARLYAKYSGKVVKGAIVALWLCKDMDVDSIVHETKQPKFFVINTLYELRQLLCEIMEMRLNLPYDKQALLIAKWEETWEKEKRQQD